MTRLLLTVPEAAEALAISRSKLYELLASYFAPNGITLVHATDGAKGLAALGADVFDAVLLDLTLPHGPHARRCAAMPGYCFSTGPPAAASSA